MTKRKQIEQLKNKAIFLEAQLEKARRELEAARAGLEEIEKVYKAIIGTMVFTYAPDGNIEIFKMDLDEFIQDNKQVAVSCNEDKYKITCE